MAVSPTFNIQHATFSKILGPDPKITLCRENTDYPFAHEAGVYIPETGDLFITSHPGGHDHKKVIISKVNTRDESYPCEEIDTDVPMGNGGVNYEDGVLFCAQGSKERDGGMMYMSRTPPYKTEMLVEGFFGRKFNSVNDVVVHADGSIWFTDPIYGFEQGFRPKPELPNQAYRFDPETKNIRAMADGFDRPNGICFSPDEKVVYITDTGFIHGDGTMDPKRPSTIYAFDVVMHAGQPFLVNRRLFAMADVGFPDGIKCDMDGNVYSGCGDGIQVWSAGGILVGKILIPGGIANFCFGEPGTIFALNEKRLWRVDMNKETRGALLKL